MPIYSFQCKSCGLSFEKRISFSQAQKDNYSTSCESCGESIKREMTTANFQFQHKADSALPQNTGIQSFDTNYDRVIGSDAEQKWKIVQKRQEEKAALLRDNPNKSGKHIRRNIDNHYELVSDKEKKAFELGTAVGASAKEKGKKIE